MTVREIEQDDAIWFPKMLSLRLKILREPLGLNFSEADLATEAGFRHFVLTDELDKLIGCGLLAKKSESVGKVSQVAISENWRGRGAGKFLMTQIEQAAAAAGLSRIELHARETAVPFYEKLGYEIVGERFIEVTLPHFAMRKVLE